MKNKKSELNTPDEFTRKLAAIVFADIVDYSKKMSEDEQETFRLLDEYKKIVALLIKQYKGQIIKWLGDGLFCSFSSALNAVDFGLALHKTLDEFNKTGRNKFPIQLRIGIHMGDVVKHDGDLFGDGVNVASRLEAQSPIGGMCISGNVYSVISSHPRFNIISKGKVPLKNINYQHELYQVKTGLEDEEPAEGKSKLPFILAALLIIIIVGVGLIYLKTKNIEDGVNDNPESKNISKEQINHRSNIPDAFRNIMTPDLENFIKDIFAFENTNEVLNYLQQKQTEMTLTFGNKSDFYDPEGKTIIVLTQKKVVTLLLYHKSKYWDFVTYEIYDNLSQKFSGKRIIWLEIFK